MAATNYPQIPRTVWFGVRDQLRKSPSVTVTDDLLAAKLDVQPTAAKQYIKELTKVGLLDENGKATDLAKKWRLQDDHAEAINEILTNAYGDELIALAPPGEAERAVVKRWFLQKGLGDGSAGNRAATYLMIANSDASDESIGSSGEAASPKKPRKRKEISPVTAPTAKPEGGASRKGVEQKSGSFIPSVNLNMQIHISSDASNEQIDAIFASMKKHLG